MFTTRLIMTSKILILILINIDELIHRSSLLTSSYLQEYFIVWNEWGPQDFGKPHLEKVHNISDSVCLLPFLLFSSLGLWSVPGSLEPFGQRKVKADGARDL